ncbi:hypothetical protein H0H81_005296 [Sphagnurus paluster]|uniref:Uncharacterized protein n=1 Tax=Sphagnurus paluster TaxID=117069 RepID=A0A9P7G2B6_9AGAR|nr:hypothetical protein H0H81_005296 [Sphagnurus paluster]
MTNITDNALAIDGALQPQGHVQVLLNMLRGLTAQAALDAPQFCITAGELDKKVNSQVFLEEGITEETIAKLQNMGHTVGVVTGFDRGMMGRGQIIQKVNNESGILVWAAGSDSRADGHAAAQI